VPVMIAKNVTHHSVLEAVALVFMKSITSLSIRYTTDTRVPYVMLNWNASRARTLILDVTIMVQSTTKTNYSNHIAFDLVKCLRLV